MNREQPAAISTSPVDHYLDLCRTDPAILDCVASARMPSSLAGIALARPLFFRRSAMEGVSAHSRDLIKLSERMSDGFFGGVDAYLEAQGTPAHQIKALKDNLTGQLHYFGRADAIPTVDGFRIVELNVGSELGGYYAGIVNRALLEGPEFDSFARDHALGFVDMRDMLTDRLRAVSKRVVGVDDPLVAIVEETGSGRTMERLKRTLEDRGLRVVAGELGDLTTDHQGKVVINGDVPVDVVLRYFFLAHLLENADDRHRAGMLTRAHLDGRTAMFTPMDSAIHESKAVLGLMYDNQVWGWMTEEERALVSKALPWTKLIGSDFPSVSPRQRAQLVEECRGRREELVLKPAGGWGGRGVRIGAALTDTEWKEALEEACSGDYVVQERVVPLTHTVIDPRTTAPQSWHSTVSVFYDEGNYGGAIVRAQPEDNVGLSEWGVKRLGCVFTYD